MIACSLDAVWLIVLPTVGFISTVAAIVILVLALLGAFEDEDDEPRPRSGYE